MTKLYEIKDIFYSKWRNTLTWRVIANASWISAAMPINIGLGIFQMGMMARMLGPSGIGTLAIFDSVCAMFGNMLKITNAEPVMVYGAKAMAEDDSHQFTNIIRHCYLTDFHSSIIAFIAVWISAFFIPQILNLPSNTESLLALYGITLVFRSTYWTSNAILRLMNKVSWIFYQSISLSLFKTIFITAFFMIDYGFDELVFLLIIISFVDGISLFILAKISLSQKSFDENKSCTKGKNLPQNLKKFQITGYFRQVIKSINRSIDTMIVGYLGNSAQVGYYHVGKQINGNFINSLSSFTTSLFPEYSILYFSNSIIRLRRLVVRFFLLFSALGILSFFFVWFSADWIISIIFGDQFLPAKDVIRIFIIAGFLAFIMTPIYSLPNAVGDGMASVYSTSYALIIQILVIIWLVPQMGVTGVAWAYVVYVLVWAIMLLPRIFKILQLHPNSDLNQSLTLTAADSLRRDQKKE